jgi:hypothetical protein
VWEAGLSGAVENEVLIIDAVIAPRVDFFYFAVPFSPLLRLLAFT